MAKDFDLMEDSNRSANLWIHEVSDPARRVFLLGTIQHPGEPLTPRDDNLEVPNLHNDPADPRKYSNWPDFRPDGRPRSATVVIRKADGGVIGT